MDKNEYSWDRLLKIRTSGRDDSHADQYKYPYEPTAYCLFFYDPSDEYMSFLLAQDQLTYYDEIPCGDLFPGNNPREKIVIFSLNMM